VGQYQQYHYIAGNEYPTKSKEKLDFANDESTYSQTHKKYHEKFRDYLSAFGYYDVFFVDAQSGDIVYSVFKEIDYASNLIDGPYKDSNIDRLYRETRLASEPGFVKLVDYKPYRPSYGDRGSHCFGHMVFGHSQRDLADDWLLWGRAFVGRPLHPPMW
jgi:methyl-accepting chemotaxis protein